MAKARRLARVRMLARRGMQRAAERAHLRLRMCVSPCGPACGPAFNKPMCLSVCAACTEPWGSGGGAMQHIWPCLSRAWSRFRLRRRARLSAQKIGSWAWCVRVQCGVRKCSWAVLMSTNTLLSRGVCSLVSSLHPKITISPSRTGTGGEPNPSTNGSRPSARWAHCWGRWVCVGCGGV